MASRETMSTKKRLLPKRSHGKVKGVDGKRTVLVTTRLTDAEWASALRAKAVLSPHVGITKAQLGRELMLLGIRVVLANSKRK